MPIVSRDVLYTSGNIPKTKALFTEFYSDGIFNLSKNNNGKSSICLYDLYMQFCVEDPTETVFAEEVFGDLYWWSVCSNAGFIKETLQEWRDLAAIKRKTMAFKAIVEEVKTKGKSSFSAARYLIDEPWLGSARANTNKRKRSSATSKAAQQSKEVQDDINRLRDQGLIN